MAGLEACAKPALYVVILINAIMFVVGLGFVILGSVIRLFATPIFSPTIADALLAWGIPADLDFSRPEIILDAIGGQAGGVLFAVAVVIWIVALLGIIGTCCKIYPLMIPYVVLLIMTFIAEAILVIMTLIGSFEGSIKTIFVDGAKTYQGIQQVMFDPWTAVWAFVNQKFQCCGVTSSTDFTDTAAWAAAQRVDKITTGNIVIPGPFVAPISCCKQAEITVVNRDAGFVCATAPTAANSNYETPCWDHLTNIMLQYKTVIIVGLVVILILQLILVIFSIIALILTKQKYDAEKKERNRDRTPREIYGYESKPKKNGKKAANKNGRSDPAQYDRPRYVNDEDYFPQSQNGSYDRPRSNDPYRY